MPSTAKRPADNGVRLFSAAPEFFVHTGKNPRSPRPDREICGLFVARGSTFPKM